VQRVLYPDPPDAPGLTPLTGQYRRPGVAYICRSTIPLGPTVTSSTDISGPLWECRRSDLVLKDAKAIYWAAKVLKLALEL